MGWLTVAFNDAVAVKLNNGGTCDGIFGIHLSECDPQVKLHINNNEVYKTQGNQAIAGKVDIFEIFTSTKINRNSSVYMEMWDDDGSSAGYLLFCDVNIPAGFSGEVLCKNNYNELSYTLHWIDEYDDNQT